jgi:hypothetical protein
MTFEIMSNFYSLQGFKLYFFKKGFQAGLKNSAGNKKSDAIETGFWADFSIKLVDFQKSVPADSTKFHWQSAN